METGENMPWDKAIKSGREFGTHYMSQMDNDGKFYIYPRIQTNENGELQKYDPVKAYKRALEQNDYIAFDNKDDAELFGKNYKIVWGAE